PDPRFVRDGADLWHSVTISLPDAVLGMELSIPTLEARATVKVLPGTQPEAVLRLRDKGLPRFGGKGRGDLYLRLHLHVPERLSHQERSLYEQLRSLAKI
ncbi:MAG TPA: DnaJ C-terminal domain-containing protein, partial [Azonexus sp.]|nr:DnaJ C-terminal domain-containing protein [Azonexus sp.]